MNAEAVAGVVDLDLQRLLSDHWEYTLRNNPTWATRLGDHRFDDQIQASGPEASAASRAEVRRWMARAAVIPIARLGPEDALNLSIFQDLLGAGAATDVCHTEQWDLSARTNPLGAANDLVDLMPIVTEADGVHLVARYRAIPTMVHGWTENLRLGMRDQRTPNRASLLIVVTMFEEQLAQPDEAWALAKVVAEPHPTWSAASNQHFAEGVRAAVAAARVSLAGFSAFVTNELMPVARDEAHVGVSNLPDGAACYAALIRSETSVSVPAADLHQIGLDQLALAHIEMRKIGARLFGTDDLAAIFEHLRSDPALRFTTREEVEAAAVLHLNRAREAIPRFFGTLPVADCVVRPVPDYIAPYTTIAYYNPAVPGGEQPGEYRINTYAPETRPTFEAAVLAYHESIPGHHLQIAIAQELPAIPAFRRHLGPNAYVEGWALYTERLAAEMGLYADDLDRMGMYSFDTWRAGRLVVDTGIHAQGWTRDQAEAFLLANTPLAANNIHNEVDRYITWPAQALSYKVGQIEILRLRSEAERTLGAKFDLRRFHDVVLSAGAVGLPVLRARVEAWVAAGG